MDLAFSDEQTMLRDTARRFLDDKAPIAAVRRVMETDRGFDDDLWREIAALGWLAMAIPEEYGGAGFTVLEQAILAEELGRSLCAVPYLSSIVLGADLLASIGTEDQKAAVLGDLASGERRVAVAQVERSGRWDAPGIEMTAERAGGGFVLSGTKSFVLDGHTADTLMVMARIGDSGEIGLLLVDADAPGIRRRRLETLDMTRPQAEIRFDRVRVPLAGLLGGAPSGWDPVAATLTRAGVALAFEQVGGARRCLDMAVDHARTRVQFGRPIGSFQAVKHICADMAVKVESAGSAAYAAGFAAIANDDGLAEAALAAQAYCSEAYVFCAAENIQVHGGIGFTWEHDAHLFYRRAKTDELLFGSPAYHRELMAGRLGLS